MTLPNRIGPLFTDQYELTMAAGYHARSMFQPATFSLYARQHPKRAYYIAAGLESALRELETYRFMDQEIDYLRSTGLFSNPFLSYLKDLRFSGEIYAIPEGTVFFPDEPILEVTAPIIEAQLVETFLLNTVGFESLIATKAARCTHAAHGRPLIDFALRRTHGQDAGLKAARSTFIGGFTATSNVLAGQTFGIPVSGTMAHSFVVAFDSEIEAFEAFAEVFPKNCVFLIDTYDTITGAKNAIQVARKLEANGGALLGVRLDSGDMVQLSKAVRTLLDDAGLVEVKIFASGSFDEYQIRHVLEQGAAIDAFGVGTKVGVSADAPFMDVVYKMVHFGGRGVRKKSTGKETLAGKKQVFRFMDSQGNYHKDVIAERSEILPGGTPLLEEVMSQGRCVKPHPELARIKEHCQRSYKGLDSKYKALTRPPVFPVHISDTLQALQV